MYKDIIAHRDFEKDANVQSSTSETLSSLQFNSGSKRRILPAQVPSLYVIIGIICGNGLTYPSMPKK